MKKFRSILILCLVALMVLSLAACKKKGDDGARSAEEIVSSAPLVLQILTDAEIAIGMDENGNALALMGLNQNGIDAVALCEDVAGKSGAEAVKIVLNVIQENEYLIGKYYVVIRQQPNSLLPSEDYLDTIAAAAGEVLTSAPFVIVPASSMDADGYFNEEIAKQILQAYLGSDAKILNSSVMIDGCFIIACEEDGVVTDYSVSAYTGAIAAYSELQGDAPLEEEDMIPEDQQFEPSDDPEGLIGAEEEPTEEPAE